MNKKLAKFNLGNVKSITEFLHQPTIKIAEALTGILASDLKDWKLSAGRLVQATIKGNLLTQLGRELKKYSEEGKIKEDFMETDINRATIKELLKFIDEEAPDEIRFKAMKSIFLSSVEKDMSQKNEELAYEFMTICKELSSGEILILKANYDITQGNPKSPIPGLLATKDRNQWFNLIAQQIGHGISSLVERYEEHLMQLKLITKRTHSDGSGMEPSQYFRLTPLGYKFCEFIVKYE